MHDDVAVAAVAAGLLWLGREPDYFDWPPSTGLVAGAPPPASSWPAFLESTFFESTLRRLGLRKDDGQVFDERFARGRPVTEAERIAIVKALVRDLPVALSQDLDLQEARILRRTALARGGIGGSGSWSSFEVVLEDRGGEWRERASWWLGISCGVDQKGLANLVYVKKGCDRCHSLDGSPGTGPTFLGLWGTRRTLEDGSTVLAVAAYVRRAILDPGAEVVAGHRPSMPPFVGRVKDAEIDALTWLLRSLAGEESEIVEYGPKAPRDG